MAKCKLTHQAYYLNQLGIVAWQQRHLQQNIQDDSWKILQQAVATCVRCPLAKTRTQPVFGVGNLKPQLVIVGEAPGREEDLNGEPFVGRAGKLLNEMLAAIGFAREDVYIANVLKCRPPNNRDPNASEVQTCTPYLEQQLTLLAPRLILAVGRIAAHYLLGLDESMAKMREQAWTFGEKKIPLRVTYHPAYLLRKPSEKRKAYGDLMKVYQFLT